MHLPPAEAESNTVRGHVAARILFLEIPQSLAPDGKGNLPDLARESGTSSWVPTTSALSGQRLYLRAAAGTYPLAECNLRLCVDPRERVFFAFHLYAPRRAGTYAVSFQLVTPTSDQRPEESTTICKRDLRVEA